MPLERCFEASVLSSEVSMTQRSRAQPAGVAGQQVVLDDAPVVGPVGGDDGAVQQSGPTRGLAALKVRGAIGLDPRGGHAESDLAVDVALATGGLPVVVRHGDFVAEESGHAGTGVGDQRFVLGQFQLEVFAQELGQALV
jgi:hypothetical protein